MYGLVKFSLIKSEIAGVPETINLLDSISPSTTAAFSTRKLRSAYAGSCLRVRRSSDNNEQDIGFVSNLLDTSSLSSFVGANDGFVVTWYDQSGNSLDFTQATAGNQPQIMASGTLKVINSKPAVEFVTANNHNLANASALSNFVTASAWTYLNTINITTFLGTANPEISGAIMTAGGFWTPCAANDVPNGDISMNQYDGADRTVIFTPTTTGTNYLPLCKFDGTTLSGYLNGGTATTAASGNIANVTDTMAMGGNTSGQRYGGLISESLIFNSALSSADLNILGSGSGIIGGNMASYAGVTWTTI